MKINIGEIEVNYELTEDEKNILTNEEQEYYKFIKETVTMQQDKINNLDKKIDALESTLRYERNVNKMIMKFLKNKFDS